MNTTIHPRQSMLAALVLMLGVCWPAWSQQDPRLLEVIRLAREGQPDSARAVVGRVLSTTTATDPIYPEVLYTVALVAANAQDRRLYLQRVSVEFNQSRWADNALLQLAQLDFATGNPAGAVRQIERLLGDYPGSDVTAEATFWGARGAFETNETAKACAWVSLGLQIIGSDIELKNRLEFLNLRCQNRLSDTSPPRSAAPPPPPASTPTPAARRAGPSWYVQVAALSDRTAIDRTLAGLKAMGYETKIEPGPGALQKIWAGGWASRDEARAQVARIRARFGGQPFVVSDSRP